MKARVITTAMIGLMVAGSVLAGELSVKGTYTDSINLGGSGTDGKGNSKGYAYTKGRIGFKVKANDQTTFYVENKLEGTAGAIGAFGIDYVYADIAMFESKLRVGTITDGTAGFTGGIYQSPCFQALSRSKGNGVVYFTKFENINLAFTNINAILNDDTAKIYAVKVDTKIEDATIGGVLKYGTAKNTLGDSKSGGALELEGTYKMGDAKLSAQYYMDANDTAANLFNYKAGGNLNSVPYKKESFLGVFGEYSFAALTGVSGLGVYADYVMALSDDTKKQWVANASKPEQGGLSATIQGKATKGTSSRMAMGAKCDLNEVAAVYYEMVNTTPVDGDTVGSSTLGLQVKF